MKVALLPRVEQWVILVWTLGFAKVSMPEHSLGISKYPSLLRRMQAAVEHFSGCGVALAAHKLRPEGYPYLKMICLDERDAYLGTLFENACC